MAQLPPKAPTMAPNWPAAAVQQQNMWVDEFLEFSSAKRSAHRRSASESIAFLEVPLAAADERRSSSAAAEFDRLDDEQLMSMFSDDIAAAAAATLPATSSNPSSPSDRNSVNDEKPVRSSSDQQRQRQRQQQQRADGEVESSCKSETTVSPAPATAAGDPIIDPKRVKRILANRQSAQRSRVRKLQYISELERSVTSLQTEVSALSPRVAFLDHQRLVLNVDNSALKQRIAALAQDKIFKDAHQEALKKEIERLRQVYHHQNLKKMEDTQQQQQQQQPEQPQICTDGDELLD